MENKSTYYLNALHAMGRFLAIIAIVFLTSCPVKAGIKQNLLGNSNKTETRTKEKSSIAPFEQLNSVGDDCTIHKDDSPIQIEASHSEISPAIILVLSCFLFQFLAKGITSYQERPKHVFHPSQKNIYIFVRSLRL